MALIPRCCCCELRIGVLIIAILGILGCCYQIYNTSVGLSWIEEHKGEYTWLESFSASYKASLFFLCVNLVFDIVLCVVASLNNDKYKILVLIWVIWMSIWIFITVIILIVIAVIVKNFVVVVAFLVAYGILIVLGIYFILVVFSYYQELRDGPTAPAPAVVVVQQPGMIIQQQPGVYVQQQAGVYVQQQPGMMYQPQPGVYGQQQPPAYVGPYDQQQTVTVTTEHPPQYTEKDKM